MKKKGLTLTIGGTVYHRWSSVRVTRGLKHAVSAFELETPGELTPTILPFQQCTIADDGDLLLTGYVVAVNIRVSGRETRTTIVGRSKTQDLADCHLLGTFTTSQFTGSTLDAIARAVCAPFGIGLVLGPGVNVGDPFADATLGQETAFEYLERLARQRAVLLTDDQNGNLVITTAGTIRAPADLVMGRGGNVAEALARLDGEGRFSLYRILSQAGITLTGSVVLTAVEAVAQDGAVPRFRPWAHLAESASMPGDAKKRANWEAAHRSGEAVNATLTVPEWRAGGALWQMNQIARCDVPRLQLDDDFLIYELEFRLDHAGRRTVLEVAPPSAFQPEPAAPKAGGGNAIYQGIIPVD